MTALGGLAVIVGVATAALFFAGILGNQGGGTTEEGSHTVVEGETLPLIAQRFGVSVGSLAELNDLSEDSELQPGQTLTIPGIEIEDVTLVEAPPVAALGDLDVSPREGQLAPIAFCWLP